MLDPEIPDERREQIAAEARQRIESDGSLKHDSGWGMAVYQRGDGSQPELIRCPEAAYVDGDYVDATATRGRIFNVHVRRATMGGLTLVNTHPFCLGNYTFGHNGTILHWPRLLEPGASGRGRTCGCVPSGPQTRRIPASSVARYLLVSGLPAS